MIQKAVALEGIEAKVRDGAVLAARDDHRDREHYWRVKTTLEKYANRREYQAGSPYEVLHDEGNMLVNVGINLIWTLVAGGTGTPFNNANAHIGVGDSSVAENANQTDLQAADNKLRKGMVTGYPVFGSAQKIVFRSEFTENEANFDWREWGVFNAATGGTMLNRKVANSGTKASGSIWVFTVEITLS